jgi:hypothetical protein
VRIWSTKNRSFRIRCSIQNSAQHQEQLLAKSVKQGRVDSTLDTLVIMTTWKVTIDKIKKENPIAVEILQFMSFLNPEDIPLEAVSKAKAFRDKIQLEIMESIGILLGFSFIQSSNTQSHIACTDWFPV